MYSIMPFHKKHQDKASKTYTLFRHEAAIVKNTYVSYTLFDMTIYSSLKNSTLVLDFHA